MRKAFLAFGFVVGASACWPVESTACGDKFLVVGRGVQRVSRAHHPASILVYARPGAELDRTARDMRLEATLRRAGHTVDRVGDEAALATTLATRRHDFVFVDSADVAAAERSAAGRRAYVVPVAGKLSREALQALEARYALVIPAGKGLGYLKRLDEAMARRAAAVSSR